MTDVFFYRGPNDTAVPANEETLEFIRSTPPGGAMFGTLRVLRDRKRLKRFFAMLRLAYDTWDPPEYDYNGLPYIHGRSQFRKLVTVVAGFYVVTYFAGGGFRIDARSIAFDAMEEGEFRVLCQKVKDVLIRNVLWNYTGEDFDRVVAELEDFSF